MVSATSSNPIASEHCRSDSYGLCRHVSADIISAGFILGIIARYTVEPERCVLRDEVLSCIQVLGSKRVQNKIVDRGIALLQVRYLSSSSSNFELMVSVPSICHSNFL